MVDDINKALCYYSFYVKFEKCSNVCKVRGRETEVFTGTKRVTLTFSPSEVSQRQTHKEGFKGALWLNSNHQKIKAYSMLTQQDMRLQQKSMLLSWSCWPPCSVRMQSSYHKEPWLGDLHGKSGCISMYLCTKFDQKYRLFLNLEGFIILNQNTPVRAS